MCRAVYVGFFARACDCEAERLRARGFSFTAALQLSRLNML